MGSEWMLTMIVICVNQVGSEVKSQQRESKGFDSTFLFCPVKALPSQRSMDSGSPDCVWIRHHLYWSLDHKEVGLPLLWFCFISISDGSCQLTKRFDPNPGGPRQWCGWVICYSYQCWQYLDYLLLIRKTLTVPATTSISAVCKLSFQHPWQFLGPCPETQLAAAFCYGCN